MTAPRSTFLSPVIWSIASSLGTQTLSFLTFAILARLLGASAFGLVALAALVIDLLLVVSNAGISEAVIQRRTLDAVDADTAFWANLVCGMAFCVMTILAAPWVAQLFGEPQLKPIVTALAAIFAITPLGAIHNARLTRELRFRSVAARNIASSLIGAGVGLQLAWAGYGVWALVGQRIAVALSLTICAWITLPWRPHLRFRWQSCSEMLRFGAYIGLSSTLNQLNIRTAEVISGAVVGPAAVAFIRAGSRIVEVLNQVTYMPFQQIAMPILARSLHERDTLQNTYLSLSRFSAFIMFPAFLGTFALAGDIVAIVFGPGWEFVADAVRIFSCAVVASQINNLIIAALTASGAPRTVLSWTGLQIAMGFAAAMAVHGWGWQAMLITSVARGYLILPFGLHLLRKHTGISFRSVLVSVRPALISSLLMLLAVFTGIISFGKNIQPVGSVSIWLPVGIAVYFTAYICQDPGIFSQMRKLISDRQFRFGTVKK